MNKARNLWTGSLFAAALVIAVPAGIAFAQTTPAPGDAPTLDQQGGPGGPQRAGQGGGQQGGFQGGMPPMGGGGAIAAGAGGVYVLQGNRVFKLDSNSLAVVAQAELPRPQGGPRQGGGEELTK